MNSLQYNMISNYLKECDSQNKYDFVLYLSYPPFGKLRSLCRAIGEGYQPRACNAATVEVSPIGGATCTALIQCIFETSNYCCVARGRRIWKRVSCNRQTHPQSILPSNTVFVVRAGDEVLRACGFRAGVPPRQYCRRSSADPTFVRALQS